MSLYQQGPGGGIDPDPSGPVLVVPPARPGPSKFQIWRGRIFLVVFVLFSLEIGIVLTVAPWTPFWSSNSLLAGFPHLREFLLNDFARGLVSGLGLTDIWLAVSEAVRYRESVD